MASVPPPNWQPSAMPEPRAPEPSAPAPSERRARAKLVVALVAAGLLAGAALVLFGSTATRISDPVAEAATISSSAAGYRVHMLIDLPSPSTGTLITGAGAGRVDARDHEASLTVAINLGASPQVTQALGSSTLRMSELVDGTTVYMKLPALAGGALGALGKPWLKLDLEKALHLPGLASIQSSPAMSDPSQMLQYLRAASDSVVAEGKQRVDGLESTHYHADISLDRVVGPLPAADQAAARSAIAQLEQATQLHTIPVDVWVDAQHLVRRLQMRIAASPTGGQPVGVGVTVDYSDYGPQPRPALPPASEVQDLSALAAAAGQ